MDKGESCDFLEISEIFIIFGSMLIPKKYAYRVYEREKKNEQSEYFFSKFV